MCVCVCVCTCIYVSIEREREIILSVTLSFKYQSEDSILNNSSNRNGLEIPDAGQDESVSKTSCCQDLACV